MCAPGPESQISASSMPGGGARGHPPRNPERSPRNSALAYARASGQGSGQMGLELNHSERKPRRHVERTW